MNTDERGFETAKEGKRLLLTLMKANHWPIERAFYRLALGTRHGFRHDRLHSRQVSYQALGLSETGGASPSVQEMAALTVSKMPVKEASAVIERLTEVKLPPATLDREARRQGQRADKKRHD